MFITTLQLLMIIMMMMMPLISTQNIYLLEEDRFPFFTIQVFFRKKIEFRGVTILLIVGNLVPFFYRKEEMVKILRCLPKAKPFQLKIFKTFLLM